MGLGLEFGVDFGGVGDCVDVAEAEVFPVD